MGGEKSVRERCETRTVCVCGGGGDSHPSAASAAVCAVKSYCLPGEFHVPGDCCPPSHRIKKVSVQGSATCVLEGEQEGRGIIAL